MLVDELMPSLLKRRGLDGLPCALISQHDLIQGDRILAGELDARLSRLLKRRACGVSVRFRRHRSALRVALPRARAGVPAPRPRPRLPPQPRMASRSAML